MKNRILLVLVFCAIPLFGISQTSTDQNLAILLKKKRDYNSQTKNGFCIQIYNGNEKKAVSRMKKFSELFPEIEIKRIYKVPEWKVQTQLYKTRLEADRVLNQIQQKYPGARVL
jgi:hypothetical protein